MRTQFFSAVINEATTLHNTTAGNAVWLVMDGRAAEQCQFMHGLVHTGLPLANTCSDHITAQDAVYQQRYNIAHKHACILHAVLARVKNRFKHARYNWYSYRYALYPPGSHTHTHTHMYTNHTRCRHTLPRTRMRSIVTVFYLPQVLHCRHRAWKVIPSYL